MSRHPSISPHSPGAAQQGPLSEDIRELSLLVKVSRILDGSVDLRDALAPVCEAVATDLGMLYVTLNLVNRQCKEISIEESYGIEKSKLHKSVYKIGEGITGEVVRSGKPIIVPRISQEPRFMDKSGARSHAAGELSYVAVPIKSGPEVLGTLSADRLWEEGHDLGEDERVLSVISSMIGQAVRLRQSLMEERRSLEAENVLLKNKLRDIHKRSDIVGSSGAMREAFALVEQVADSNATVLIRGESGTGKELFANAIHYASRRAQAPLICVNCAAIPDSLIESELFGHEKGAFTDAVSTRKGRFELAEGGTIFLDEIGDISLQAQVKLLRVLQEREIQRVGGERSIKVDVRVIAATNRHLEEMIAKRQFREDLYYRLNVFPIHIPALRERKSDIVLLADHFVEKYAGRQGKKVVRISTPAIDLMMSYHWPGNVRELENCVERAVLLSTDGVIHSHHLPPSLQSADSTGTKFLGTLEESLGRYERELLIDALKSSAGSLPGAAEILGLAENKFALRLERHGIDPALYL